MPRKSHIRDIARIAAWAALLARCVSPVATAMWDVPSLGWEVALGTYSNTRARRHQPCGLVIAPTSSVSVSGNWLRRRWLFQRRLT